MKSVPPGDTGSTFPQRLGYYILGIALGLMILGWFQVQKLRVRQAAGAGEVQSETGAPPAAGP